MIGLLKGAAWIKAPKKMFAVTNPKKAALIKAVDWATDRVGHRRRKRSWHERSSLRGLGAAAVALPLGLWAGRKVWGRGEETQTAPTAGQSMAGDATAGTEQDA